MDEEKEGEVRGNAPVPFLQNIHAWNTVIPDYLFFFFAFGLPCSNITLINPSHPF